MRRMIGRFNTLLPVLGHASSMIEVPYLVSQWKIFEKMGISRSHRTWSGPSCDLNQVL